MSRTRSFRLGDLQLRIMKILWKTAPASVAQVQQRLQGEPLAYTTVATMLRKMEDRRLVRHQEQGRRFLYEPAVRERDVSCSMADELVDRLFEGSLADAVSHLLEVREVDDRELAQLEKLIKRRRQRRR